MLRAATERIVRFVATLPEQPAEDLDGGAELARSLLGPLPERGRSFEELLALVFDRALPTSLNCASPGFLAYIPGGGLFDAAVGDLLADVMNRYTTVADVAPGLAALEWNVVRWFCDLVGFGPEGGGFLSTGASLANLSAIVAARTRHLGEDFVRGTAYLSDQTHHSLLKSAVIAGLPARNVRRIPVDGAFRIRVDALRQAIADDRRAGLQPFLITGSAGTTNTGAVDDLEALADVARDEGLWLHHDAAYGGFFLLTERGRRALRGIGRADSVALDPHKGLFLPYGTGCLLVRDVRTLERSHRVDADYMPARAGGGGFPSACDLSPELSREFRGLRVWLPLQLRGAAAFRAALDEKLDLAAWAAAELARIDGIRILAEPQLTVVAFRFEAGGGDAAARNDRNRELQRRVNARRRVNITGTVIDGGFVLRICVLSFRTHREHVARAIEDVAAAAAELRGRG